MLRVLMASLLALIIATPASADHRDGQNNWNIWGSKWSQKYKKKRYHAAKRKPAYQANYTGWNWPLPANASEPKPWKKGKMGPAVMSGGGRPNIFPKTPPVVKFRGKYSKASIVIDTAGRKLYYVLGSGKAYRYPISVGRSGFSWTGTKKITAKKAWPDWHPPAEMRKRKPSLPKKMTGGVNNPLGAKALYLGNSLYRIHGTNNVKSIGRAASSGCFRMMNAHVEHLSRIAKVGTTVRVLKRLPKSVVAGPSTAWKG